jgi:hypothetical protein
MMHNRERLFLRGFAEHGDIFAIKLGLQYAGVVSGAEHNKVFYTQTDRSLKMKWQSSQRWFSNSSNWNFTTRRCRSFMVIAPITHQQSG